MGPAGCTTSLVDTLTVCLGVGTSTHGAEKEFSDLFCVRVVSNESKILLCGII